jgi:hypothetical protein
VVRIPNSKIRGPGFDSRLYQIFCLAIGLEQESLSFVKINEELQDIKSNGSGLKN